MFAENRVNISELATSNAACGHSRKQSVTWVTGLAQQHRASSTSINEWFPKAGLSAAGEELSRGSNPRSNALLALLPEEEWQRVAPYLERVDMPQGLVLSEALDRTLYMYFPTTAVVSLSYVMENGASGEVAVIGRDGLVGVSLLMANGSAPHRAVVQTAGKGFRLPGRIIKAEFNRGGRVLELFLNYMMALINHTSQTAICNRHHSVDQQLCRRLLQSLDLQDDHEIVVTHERIAGMLGVRREGVTAAALSLQEAGLIKYARGHISILDRAGLEKRSCECYSAVRSAYRQLMPSVGSGAKSSESAPTRYRSALSGVRVLNTASA